VRSRLKPSTLQIFREFHAHAAVFAQTEKKLSFFVSRPVQNKKTCQVLPSTSSPQQSISGVFRFKKLDQVSWLESTQRIIFARVTG